MAAVVLLWCAFDELSDLLELVVGQAGRFASGLICAEDDHDTVEWFVDSVCAGKLAAPGDVLIISSVTEIGIKLTLTYRRQMRFPKAIDLVDEARLNQLRRELADLRTDADAKRAQSRPRVADLLTAQR